MKKIMYLLSIGLMVTLLGCGAAPVAKDTSPVVPVTKAETPPSPTQKKANAVGDTFKLGDLQYKINSVRVSAGGDYGKPKDGNTFLLIDTTVENQGTEDAIVSSMMSFKLVNKEGRSQDYSISALMGANGKMDGTLAAGRKITGELGYEVSKTAQTYELEIISDQINSEIGIVEIPMK